MSNPRLCDVARSASIGILLTPDTALVGAHYERVLGIYPAWAADNGCFSHPERPLTVLLEWLAKLPKTGLFFPAPDVVGNAEQTLKQAKTALPEIQKLGYKTAFVAQDGIENHPPPWDEFNCLFIGGTTEFKLSNQSRNLIEEAKTKGKWVHMGRVNSYRRLSLANKWGCDSADGTYLRFTGPKGVDTVLKWLEKIKGEL